MGISRRDQKILLYAGGLLLVALVWFFVFQKAQERNTALEQENVQLQQELDKLRVLAADEPHYKEETQRMKQEETAVYKKFPADVKEETAIMYACDLEKTGELFINDIAMNPRNLVFTTGQKQEEGQTGSEAQQESGAQAETGSGARQESGSQTGTGSGAQSGTGKQAGSGNQKSQDSQNAGASGQQETGNQPAVKNLYSTNVTYGCLVTYAGAKKMTEYMFDDVLRRTIRSIALTYDKESGNLTGTVNVDFYSLDGTDSMFEEPWIPALPAGEENIFGTMEHLNRME